MNLRTLLSLGALVSCIAIPGVASARPIFHVGHGEVIRPFGGPRFVGPRVVLPSPVITAPAYMPPVVSEPVVEPGYFAPPVGLPVVRAPMWLGRPVFHALRPMMGGFMRHGWGGRR